MVNFCGIDEVGRGALAGPVVAACFMIQDKIVIDKASDSKKISKKNRLKLYQNLVMNSMFGIGVVSEEVIDKINILEATKLAMKIAYTDCCSKNNLYPKIVLVDGNFIPFDLCDKIEKIIPIIKGDEKNSAIASASIIAKEYRDNLMSNYHLDFPQYGFNTNYGYGTNKHILNINKFGICKIHRRTFEPIKSILSVNN